MAEQELNERFDVREAERSASGVTTLELSGQLDAHTAPVFERFLEERVRGRGKQKLVLDFTRLDYISSAGLGVLMGLIEEVRSNGGDMRLANLPEKIFHVLDLLGFPVVFQIFKTRDEAVNSFVD
jgi:anti-sigma B factor antagonist